MAFFQFHYRPTESEPYMNSKQLDYFREKLMRRQTRLTQKLKETMQEIRDQDFREADLFDRSDDSVFRDRKLQNCEHYRNLINQNEMALRRIEDGTFGYCRITGEEIGLKRLEALPHALLSVEAQEMLESGVPQVA
jgi:DnaK suppressor protein